MATSYSTVRFRIDNDIKSEADELFAKLGLSMSTAFNIFLRQTLRDGGIPFQITANTPNDETIEAMIEANYLSNSDDIKGYEVHEALALLKK